MKPCEACSVGKVKQNNVTKNSDHDPEKVNSEQIFINISSVKRKRGGPPFQSKRSWLIMVYKQTNLNFTKLSSTNNGIIEPTLEQI